MSRLSKILGASRFRMSIGLLLWILLGMVVLGSCSTEEDDDDDSDSTAGIQIPNPDTEDEDVLVDGSLARVTSSNNPTGRTQSGGPGTGSKETITLYSTTGEELGSVRTNNDGYYSTTVTMNKTDLPLWVRSTVDGEDYSTTTMEWSETSEGQKRSFRLNLNDITTVIADNFNGESNKSLELLNLLAEQAVVQRFGTNSEGSSQIPPSTFTTGDFQDKDHLGRLLLTSVERLKKNSPNQDERNFSLRNAITADNHLMRKDVFLEELAKQLRDDGHQQGRRPPPSDPLQGQGSNNLYDALFLINEAVSQNDIDQQINSLKGKMKDDGLHTKHKGKLSDLQEKIDRHKN